MRHVLHQHDLSYVQDARRDGKGCNMKKAETSERPDDGALRPDYDFSKGRRGVTARRYAQGVVVHKLGSNPQHRGS